MYDELVPLKEVVEILTNYDKYSQTLLQVLHRDERIIVPLKLKPIQKKIINAIRDGTKKGIRTMIAILKARQMGCSTAIASYFFYRIISKPLQFGIVMSHKGESLDLIYEVYRRFYEFLPETYGGIKIKPKRSGTHGRAMQFREIDSMLHFITAGGKESGRSGSCNLVHLSECAFYPDLGGVLGIVTAQVPVMGNSVIVLESTSAGPDNEFSELFLNAQKGKGDLRIIPLFFAWFEDPDYRLKGHTVDKAELDDEEKWLIKQFNLDGEQLAWRRYKIEVDCQGDVRRFRREYPATVEDCFCLLGDVVWDREVIEAVCDIKPPIWRGELTSSGRIENPEGRLLIWEEPKPQVNYVIGVDTSAGISEGHLAAIEVFRVGRKNEYPVQVAEWAGYKDPLDLAQDIALIGHYYNNALVAVEINNTGIATQGALQKVYFYPNLHRWVPWDAYRSRSDKYGWQTSYATRPIMLSIADWLIRNSKILIRSRFLKEELDYFQYVGGDALGVKGDDRIDAMMIAFTSWFQHIFAGIPLKNLKEAVRRLYETIEVKGVVKDETATEKKDWWNRQSIIEPTW